MTVSDGYGDSGYDLYEQAVLEKERLLQIQASERTQDPNLRDDVIQEGRITVWRVLQKRPDAPGAYIHASTGMRMVEVLSRGVWYGMEGQQGKAKDPLRRTNRDSFDDPSFELAATAPDVLDTVLMGYHYGEILEAIRALPVRYQEYVVLRFWGGWTHVELAPVVGVKPGNMARMWHDTIQPLLAERLAHLVDA